MGRRYLKITLDGERNISGPRWDIFEKMPHEMKLKYDPFLDGYTKTWIPRWEEP